MTRGHTMPETQGPVDRDNLLLEMLGDAAPEGASLLLSVEAILTHFDVSSEGGA